MFEIELQALSRRDISIVPAGQRLALWTGEFPEGIRAGQVSSLPVARHPCFASSEAGKLAHLHARWVRNTQMSAYEKYYAVAREQLEKVFTTQRAAIDPCVELRGMHSPVGPTSSITGAFIVNAMSVQGIENALARGVAPEIYISSNTNGDDHNNKLLQKYKSRIRHL